MEQWDNIWMMNGVNLNYVIIFKRIFIKWYIVDVRHQKNCLKCIKIIQIYAGSEQKVETFKSWLVDVYKYWKCNGSNYINSDFKV